MAGRSSMCRTPPSIAHGAIYAPMSIASRYPYSIINFDILYGGEIYIARAE